MVYHVTLGLEFTQKSLINSMFLCISIWVLIMFTSLTNKQAKQFDAMLFKAGFSRLVVATFYS